MTAEEIAQLLVASNLHRLDIALAPGIHLNRTDKTQMDLCVNATSFSYSQATMLTGTLQTHKHTIRNRCPLGSRRSAVNANLHTHISITSSHVISRHSAELLQDRTWHTIHCSSLLAIECVLGEEGVSS